VRTERFRPITTSAAPGGAQIRAGSMGLSSVGMIAGKRPVPAGQAKRRVFPWGDSRQRMRQGLARPTRHRDPHLSGPCAVVLAIARKPESVCRNFCCQSGRRGLAARAGLAWPGRRPACRESAMCEGLRHSLCDQPFCRSTPRVPNAILRALGRARYTSPSPVHGCFSVAWGVGFGCCFAVPLRVLGQVLSQVPERFQALCSALAGQRHARDRGLCGFVSGLMNRHGRIRRHPVGLPRPSRGKDIRLWPADTSHRLCRFRPEQDIIGGNRIAKGFLAN